MNVLPTPIGKEPWTVQVPAADLRAAATAKREHHEAKLAEWQTRYDEALTLLREKGIEVREAAVQGGGQYGRPQMMAARMGDERLGIDLVVDQQMQKEVNDCKAKCDEHSAQVEHYRRWESFFSRAPAAQTFDCDINDFTEFGL